MAIPDTLGARLIEACTDLKLGGRFAMLGRQSWIGARKGRSKALLERVVAERLPGVTVEDLANTDDRYSETFFRHLGFDTVDSIDVSDFEGASLIQDLSKPIDASFKDRFDVIYDGGTCEHIFDLPTAYRNIDEMLAPGGVLIGHSLSNNWVNHGYFQISPETVFGFWQNAMGYEVLDLFLQPLLPNSAHLVVRTTNPAKTGNRPRLKGRLTRQSPIVMCYVVRKPLTRVEGTDVYQSDYVRKWDA